MNTAIPIFMILISTAGIIFGYLLLRNPRALGLKVPRWVAWVIIACGILGVLGFDLWLTFRTAG
jgi:hypothetical protein